MIRALLTSVIRLLDLELDGAPSMQPSRPLRPAATRRWRRTPRPRPMSGNSSKPMMRRGTPPRPPRDATFNPEQLMQDLETFLRQERERGAE